MKHGACFETSQGVKHTFRQGQTDVFAALPWENRLRVLRYPLRFLNPFSRCQNKLWAETSRNLAPWVCLSTLRKPWKIRRHLEKTETLSDLETKIKIPCLQRATLRKIRPWESSEWPWDFFSTFSSFSTFLGSDLGTDCNEVLIVHQTGFILSVVTWWSPWSMKCSELYVCGRVVGARGRVARSTTPSHTHAI